VSPTRVRRKSPVRAAGGPAAAALRAVPRAAVSIPPAWRRRLAIAIAGLAVLACAYWFWFRDSSFARVHDVYVTGVSGPQARAIRSRLEDAGLDQSTLDVKVGDLKSAVADYPVVRSISAQGDFPHALNIDVALNLPVGVLETPSGRTPVAGDGLLLPDVPISSSLPVLATNATVPSDRVTEGRPFDLVRVVALAPDALRGRIKWVGYKPVGLVADIKAGPELRFGNASRLPAKWIAAMRVLAAPAAKGASYIDLRLPERPAAGGLPTTGVIPLAPAGDTTTTPQATPQTTTTAPQPSTTTTPAATPTTTLSTTTAAAATNPQPQIQSSAQPSTTP
jgi:cell division protein FtsQ